MAGPAGAVSTHVRRVRGLARRAAAREGAQLGPRGAKCAGGPVERGRGRGREVAGSRGGRRDLEGRGGQYEREGMEKGCWADGRVRREESEAVRL